MHGELCGDLCSSKAQPWAARNSRVLSLCGNHGVSSIQMSEVSVAAAAAGPAVATELLSYQLQQISVMIRIIVFCAA